MLARSPEVYSAVNEYSRELKVKLRSTSRGNCRTLGILDGRTGASLFLVTIRALPSIREAMMLKLTGLEEVKEEERSWSW